jgi:putative ABC transport system permease protein
MDLPIRPIFASLVHNAAGSLLVVMQVAVALAVFANATWVVHQRVESANRPTGVDDQNLFAISTSAFGAHYNYDSTLHEDLAYLRNLAGVVAAAPTDAVTFSQTGFTTDIWTNPEQKGVPEDLNTFSMDEQGLKALGGRLIAGREFRAEEIAPPLTTSNVTEFVPVIMVTKVVGDELFPGKNPLGATVYDTAGKPSTIVGVMDNMIGSAPHGLNNADHFALIPRLPQADELIYLVRTELGQRDQVMATAEAHLAKSSSDRVVNYALPVDRFKRRLFLDDTNMEILLTTVSVLVILTTCMGIFGLGMFNVASRTRQIGTRRALGARKRDIRHYFMLENGVLTAAGSLLGCALSLVISFWLSSRYASPPLNPIYLFANVPILWAIGQLAAWYPAHRASNVPPSVATRAD